MTAFYVWSSKKTNVYDRSHDSITDCCEQAERTNANRVNELLMTLGRTDNKKLPLFYEALEETDQEDVIQMLRGNGR